MKILILFIFILIQLPTYAKTWGAGLMLGNPTGANAKYWLKEDQAVDVGFGWSIGPHTNVSLHSDYLFHQEGALVFKDSTPLDLYYGGGLRMEFAGDIELGLRVPIGLAYKMMDDKADLFGEIAPIWDFVSRHGIELHFLVGARYYL